MRKLFVLFLVAYVTAMAATFATVALFVGCASRGPLREIDTPIIEHAPAATIDTTR